jgi:hypothetical protein
LRGYKLLRIRNPPRLSYQAFGVPRRQTETSTSGVNHTKKWRSFAKLRAKYFSEQQKQDDYSDVRFIIGLLDMGDHVGQKDKPILEKAESYIFSNCNGIQTAITELLWPAFVGEVVLLPDAARRNLVD